MTYSVDSLADLNAKVLPFFERHPLVVKHVDFQAFAEVVRALRRKEHFTQSGFERLVRLAYGMNAVGKQRARSIHDILGSSETARQAVPQGTEDTVRSAWRHAESGRNDLASYAGSQPGRK